MSGLGSAGPHRLGIFLLCLPLLLSLPSCVDSFLEPEPDRPEDPVLNFDLLWREFDRHYSFFLQKDVDWDGAYARYRPRVDAGTSPAQLLGVVSEMLDELRDGHVNVRSPVGAYAYDAWKDGHPDNFDLQLISEEYFAEPPTRASAGPFVYGRLRDGPGYVHIRTFGGDGFGRGIDEALRAMDGVPALVVDIRDNGGGSDLNLDEVVGRFTDRKRRYRYVQYRDGPGHDDFTDPIADHVEPRGARRFRGPVAVLTNRLNFSAAEDFVLAMRLLPNVVVVGDTTGGGMGNPIGRELPNGWTYRLSRWQVYDADRVLLLDGEGLVPDVAIRFTDAFAAQDRDPILESALFELAAGG